MADIYNMLRQFGKDVSGAIQAGPRAELEVLQTKDKLGRERTRDLREQAKIQEEEKKRGHRTKAAELLGQGKMDSPEFYNEAYQAGESLSSLAALKKSGQKKGDKPDRYKEEFKLGANLAMEANRDLGAIAKTIADKEAAGEDTTEDMKMFEAKRKGYKAGLERYRDTFELKFQPTYANQISQMTDDLLGKYDANALSALNQSFLGALDRYGSEIAELQNDLDDNPDPDGIGADLSGIPSTTDIQTQIAADLAKGLYDRDVATGVLEQRDPEELQTLIADPHTPKALKRVGAAIWKKMLISEKLNAANKNPKRILKAIGEDPRASAQNDFFSNPFKKSKKK